MDSLDMDAFDMDAFETHWYDMDALDMDALDMDVSDMDANLYKFGIDNTYWCKHSCVDSYTSMHCMQNTQDKYMNICKYAPKWVEELASKSVEEWGIRDTVWWWHCVPAL